MRMMVLAVCAACLVLAGCTSKKQRHEEMMRQTPLALDPTEQHDFNGWWSNGREMLRLGIDDSYELFATTNQYAQPIQRGRWSQQNYATLWLEPYSELNASRVRVTVMKVDGAINIALPGANRPSFWRIAAPPTVLEDRLFGKWTGVPGELELTPGMRYTLAPKEAADDAAPPGVTVGHRGTWALANDEIVLQPDTGAVQVLRWKVVADGQNVKIDTPQGALARVK